MTALSTCACGGLGWVVDDNRGASRCPCRKLKPEVKLMRAGVSAWDAAWSMGRVGELREKAQQGLDVLLQGGGVLFTGPVGTRKTCTAVAIAKELMANGRRLEWLYFPSWLDELRESHKEEAVEREGILLEHAYKAEALVLDDLGLGRVTTYGAETVTKLIHRRNGRATLVTSNLSPEGIRQNLGAAAHSRLREYLHFEFAGKDQRRPRTYPQTGNQAVEPAL